MHRKSISITLALMPAVALVTLFVPPLTVTANASSTATALLDTDGDFLPDAVEWVVLTSPALADTDADQIPDFVEVVEAGNPRHESAPVPPDQQMRLVITGPQPGDVDQRTWMHLFLRVFSIAGDSAAASSPVQSLDVWLERPLWPGARVPLNGFASAGLVHQERVTQDDGVWVQVSFPLVSEALLRNVLPCTIYAESLIAGKSLTSGVKLIPVPDGIATIVPYAQGRFAVQTLSPVVIPTTHQIQSNRVCVLELQEESSGPAGVTYLVSAADCEDANELECSPVDCAGSVGWTITIPGGTETIGAR